MTERLNNLYAEWQSLQPLTEQNQQRLNRKFMLEFNYNSNHIEGNTLTYGQTELLLLFGKVVDAANMKDLEDMKASNVGLNMMKEQALSEYPLTETFIRQLHHTLLREDYTVYRNLPGGKVSSYIVHAGRYKTRPNSVITRTGERFEYASPEETPSLMADLVNWFNEQDGSGVLTIAELCALFHYRYIRIHPFEDDNGRIARLLVNFILHRHGYPMIVVQSRDKENYLTALSLCDVNVGMEPSAGAHADIDQIRPFVSYIENCIERALEISIKAAKGESIEEEDDFIKELKLLQQEMQNDQNKPKYSIQEVWNILEYVYFPIEKDLAKAVNMVSEAFQFGSVYISNILSKTLNYKGGIPVNQVSRETTNSQILDYAANARSMWFKSDLCGNSNSTTNPVCEINKTFYITFFEDHYFVNGILNKNFAYGKYPTAEDRMRIISHFKQELLQELKDKLAIPR